MKNENTYQTGRTQPPKSRQGLIALLLIVVILLTGAVSILSLMNIRLFQMLEKQNSQSVMFSEDGIAPASLEDPEGIYAQALGVTGEEFTPLYRSYQQWPQGIYISRIDTAGPAAAADVQIGDILTALDDTAVSDYPSFEKALSELCAGKKVILTLFREGQELTVPLLPAENENG